MITKYWWFLKVIQPFSGGLDVYNFHHQFSIDAITHLTDYNILYIIINLMSSLFFTH